MAEKKKNWIKKATAGSHGQFKAKAEKAGKTTKEFAAEHSGDSGKTGQQARLANNLMGMGRKPSDRQKRLYNKSSQKD